MNVTEAFVTPGVEILLSTQFRIYDRILGLGLWACLIIGLPGNYLALRYFIFSRKRNVSTLLYIVACVIDIASSIVHIPVAVILFNDRDGWLLESQVFCPPWYFLLLTLQLMSMYVAMLLALSRAIVILFPFYSVNRKTVFASVIIVTIYQGAWNTIYLILAKSTYYSKSSALCFASTSQMNHLFFLMYQCNYNFWSILPPVVVTFSLIASVVKLKRESICITSETLRKNQQASVTIAYFSIIFLISNSFSFINNTLYIITVEVYDMYPGPFYENNFMFFYSWMLSFLYCTVINAALNPVLYFWRIKKMRMWAMGQLRRVSVKKVIHRRYLTTNGIEGTVLAESPLSRAETEF